MHSNKYIKTQSKLDEDKTTHMTKLLTRVVLTQDNLN